MELAGEAIHDWNDQNLDGHRIKVSMASSEPGGGYDYDSKYRGDGTGGYDYSFYGGSSGSEQRFQGSVSSP